jgi:hypothetical protein
MTITLTREEAQQVLDALYSMSGTEFLCQAAHHPKKDMHKSGEVCPVAARYMEARETLRARLAQPEPEPVADKYLMEVECTKCGAKQDGILTVNTPPQREWQGLTDEEMFNCLAQTDGEAKRLPLGFKWFAEAIEAKLKEKNNGV